MKHIVITIDEENQENSLKIIRELLKGPTTNYFIKKQRTFLSPKKGMTEFEEFFTLNRITIEGINKYEFIYRLLPFLLSNHLFRCIPLQDLELVLELGNNRTSENVLGFDGVQIHKLNLIPERSLFAGINTVHPVEEFSHHKEGFILLWYDKLKFDSFNEKTNHSALFGGSQHLYYLKDGIKDCKVALKGIIEVRVKNIKKAKEKAKELELEYLEIAETLDDLKEKILALMQLLTKIYNSLNAEGRFKAINFKWKTGKILGYAVLDQGYDYVTVQPNELLVSNLKLSLKYEKIIIQTIEKIEEFIEHHEIDLHPKNIKNILHELTKFKKIILFTHDKYVEIHSRKDLSERDAGGGTVIGLSLDISFIHSALYYLINGDNAGATNNGETIKAETGIINEIDREIKEKERRLKSTKFPMHQKKKVRYSQKEIKQYEKRALQILKSIRTKTEKTNQETLRKEKEALKAAKEMKKRRAKLLSDANKSYKDIRELLQSEDLHRRISHSPIEAKIGELHEAIKEKKYDKLKDHSKILNQLIALEKALRIKKELNKIITEKIYNHISNELETEVNELYGAITDLDLETIEKKLDEFIKLPKKLQKIKEELEETDSKKETSKHEKKVSISE